jgi:hypothetical protein
VALRVDKLSLGDAALQRCVNLTGASLTDMVLALDVLGNGLQG